MKSEKIGNVCNRFECRLQRGNWWETENECLNLHDINKPPRYYTGTEKEWIEEITTYIYSYPAVWVSIYEQYQFLSKENSVLQFYRNEEGYLRQIGIDEVYLKVTGESEPLKSEALNRIGKTLEEQAEELFYAYLEYARMDAEGKAVWTAHREENIRKHFNKRVSVTLVETLDGSDFAGNELYFDLLNNLYIIL